MNGFMGYEIPSNQFELVKDAQWVGNEMSNGFGKHYGDLQCNYIKCKAVSTQSDKNLKNNIQTLENCLAKIEKLKYL